MKLKRLQSLLLAVILVLSTVIPPDYVLAEKTDQATGLCPHHTEHTGCSYQEGFEGSPCSHVHDTECGYREAKAEVPCDKECTDTDQDNVTNHIEGCAYQPAVEGHECSHQHDGGCGYEEAIPSVPCDFVCAICDCICTSQCSEGAGNEDCPVCMENPANCTFTAVDVSLTFDKDSAEYREDGGASYALMSGNTFVNIIYDTVTISGEKLWTNLPDEYPLADLPSVTFTLSRLTEGGSEEPNIASMTIDGEDWQNLNVNGHYVFVFGHTGVNAPASSFNEDRVPSGASLLPRFDDKGRLYTYTLKETIDWTDTDAGNAGETDGIFAFSSSGQTFTNKYQDSGNNSIRIKKFLRVPAGQEVYPAFGFKLTRTYITDEGNSSAPEFVIRTSYNADDVKGWVKENAGNAAPGEMVTADFTIAFNGLAVYAPNGSKYTYTVTEENTSELGGFDTWVAEGDYSESKWEWVKTNGTKSSEFTGLVPMQHTNDKSDVTFLNETQENLAPIQLTGKKIWKDLDASFRPEVTEGLEITLERRANAQTGQDNAIDWEKVDIADDININWTEDTEQKDSWTYTITGLERYAPNGMPWMYRVTEEPVKYYKADGNGVASQYSQDPCTGNITMNDLTNTMYTTSTSFKKTWVDSDGRTVTENLLGSGIELEVSYELQVRAKAEAGSGDNQWSVWQKAQDYFKDFSELAGCTYSGSIRGVLGDSLWNQSYRGTGNSFNNLPRYVKDNVNTIYALEYRVVETGVKVWRNGREVPLLTQTYTAPVNKGGADYAYTVNTISGGASGVSLFAPYYGAKNEQPNNTTNHINQIETAAITVSKEWREDHNEVYETRPATDADRYDWEVTLAVLRSTDGGKQWDPTPVKTVTLYGTNEEDRKEATVSGLPAFIFDTEGTLQACTYCVRELQSEEAAGGAADREQLETGDTFNESYTVSYSDDGLTAVNTLNSTEFQGEKVWSDEEETHGNVTLELKYLKPGASGSSGSSGSSGASVENPPQTGDETNLTFWVIMCCAGILGFIAAYFAKKRLK